MPGEAPASGMLGDASLALAAQAGRVLGFPAPHFKHLSTRLSAMQPSSGGRHCAAPRCAVLRRANPGYAMLRGAVLRGAAPRCASETFARACQPARRAPCARPAAATMLALARPTPNLRCLASPINVHPPLCSPAGQEPSATDHTA